MLTQTQKRELYQRLDQIKRQEQIEDFPSFNLWIQAIIEVGNASNFEEHWLNDFYEHLQAWSAQVGPTFERENLFSDGLGSLHNYLMRVLTRQHIGADQQNEFNNVVSFVEEVLKNPKITVFFYRLLEKWILAQRFFYLAILASFQCENLSTVLYSRADLDKAIKSEEDFLQLFDRIMPNIHSLPAAFLNLAFRTSDEAQQFAKVFLPILAKSPVRYEFYWEVSRFKKSPFHPYLIQHFYETLQKPLSQEERDMIHEIIMMNGRFCKAYLPLLLVGDVDPTPPKSQSWRISRWVGAMWSKLWVDDLSDVKSPLAFVSQVDSTRLEQWSQSLSPTAIQQGIIQLKVFHLTPIAETLSSIDVMNRRKRRFAALESLQFGWINTAWVFVLTAEMALWRYKNQLAFKLRRMTEQKTPEVLIQEVNQDIVGQEMQITQIETDLRNFSEESNRDLKMLAEEALGITKSLQDCAERLKPVLWNSLAPLPGDLHHRMPDFIADRPRSMAGK